MVRGFEKFTEAFKTFEDCYVLIGGVACLVAMEDVGLDFRTTKDFDIVLIVEALNSKFVKCFWQFIQDGGYEIREKSSGKKEFYRFQKPTDRSFPFMLELFSRKPDVLKLSNESTLTPIPTDQDVSSLSAILLNADYYSFISSHKIISNGLSVVSSETLIPLKAKAWLDLSERLANGERIDRKVIKKHKNDIIRLFALLSPELSVSLPNSIREDFRTFIKDFKQEEVNFKQFGLGTLAMDEFIENLSRIFGVLTSEL